MEGKCRVTCILDQGCQIIAISKAFWESLGVSLLTNRRINMTSANSTVERSLGLIPRLHIRFGLVELVVQAHVMPNAPFDVLLGRPFFQVGLCRTVDFANGEQHITITNPVSRQEITIPTQTRRRSADGKAAAQVRGEGLYHASVMLWEQDEGDGVDVDEIDAGRELEVEECEAFAVTLEEVEGEERESFKYKKVANKTKPVATTLPEEFRIVRRSPSDALANLPALPTDSPQFVPTGRYTQER